MHANNNISKHKTNIIRDENNNPIIIINDVRFKGRQNIKWDEVERYLKEYIGKHYEILESSDTVFIGSDFPNELKGSEDTKRFGLPVYASNGQLERYNIFRIEMLIRHASDNKLYLYDMVNIKKRNEYPA